MKKILFVLSITLLFISCNDDDVAPAQETIDALVTRISENGVTKLELLFDIERRLSRINYYFQGNYSYYMLIEYSEDGLKELRRYRANDHSLNFKSVLTLDNFGRVIKTENTSFTDFGDVVGIIEFDYNASGQLIAQELRIPGDPVYTRKENTYDSDGNLIKQETTFFPNQEEEYVGNVFEYTPGSEPIPESWENYVFIFGLSDLEDDIRNMFISGFHYQSWKSNGETNFELICKTSDQIFDENGNLISQVITRQNLLNPQNPDVVTNMSYDYQKEN
jgi:hypothetical protein